MEEFLGNGKRAKNREKCSTDIDFDMGDCSVNIDSKKNSIVSKAFNAFSLTDGNTVKNKVKKDVVIPGIKSLLGKVVHAAADMFLYGEDADTDEYYSDGTRRRRRRRTYGNETVSYGSTDDNDYSSDGKRKFDNVSAPQDILKQLTFKTEDGDATKSRRKANELLDKMNDIIDNNGQILVGELFSMLKVKNIQSDTWSWGWTDLSTAKIKTDYDTGVSNLVLPQPTNLD